MGDDLESFQSTWTMVMSELATAPDPAILQYCYFKPLADDIAYYKRARFAADATDHSFAFLLEAATRYLRMKMGGLHARTTQPWLQRGQRQGSAWN